MLRIRSINQLPSVSAVYAFCGGRNHGVYVVYIGVTDQLKSRIHQHLIRRGSSVATGTSAVMLIPDYVTSVSWWEHLDFSDRVILEAAELVAFELEPPNPALRS